MNKEIFKHFWKKVGLTLLMVLIVLPIIIAMFFFSKKIQTESFDCIRSWEEADNGNFTGLVWLVCNTPDEILVKMFNVKLKSLHFVCSKGLRFWTDPQFKQLWLS